jgi:hypothetical protein
VLDPNGLLFIAWSVFMFAHKRRITFAVLLFLAMAALGSRMFLWRTNTVELQETGQDDAGKHTDPGPVEKHGVTANQGTRQEFARAMVKIKEGMAKKEVLALLGKPDDIRTATDPGGISTTRTREIWRYGTDGHLTFPTLGCVYIDNEGKVQYVYGARGAPPDPKILPEMELRDLLRLIDKAPSYNSGYHYDPLAVIQIVNTLQPLGKDKALSAIDEFLRVASDFDSPAREGVFLVLRVLFDVPADPGHMPPMHVGAPWPAAPIDPKRLPRFPILLQDDVPLLLVSGYMLGGFPEQPESHVKYFRQKGRLRDKLLAPGNAPFGLLEDWAKNAGWLYKNGAAWEGKMLIANQLLALVDSIYRRDTDLNGYKFWATDKYKSDDAWKSIECEVAKLDIRWNPDQNRYTFKDGSRLPEPISKLYRRYIWKLDGLNGEASLIFERRNKKRVWVSLEWSGKKDQNVPSFVLNVFGVKDQGKPLAELRPSSISAVGGDEGFSAQSFEVELAEGAEIQARLKIAKRGQSSPVYKP